MFNGWASGFCNQARDSRCYWLFKLQTEVLYKRNVSGLVRINSQCTTVLYHTAVVASSFNTICVRFTDWWDTEDSVQKSLCYMSNKGDSVSSGHCEFH